MNEVLEGRGQRQQTTYGRPVFKKPDTVEKVSEGLRMFREATDGSD